MDIIGAGSCGVSGRFVLIKPFELFQQNPALIAGFFMLDRCANLDG